MLRRSPGETGNLGDEAASRRLWNGLRRTILVLVWLLAAAPSFASLPVLGDLDGDGKVTVLDLTRLQQHLTGANPLSLGLQIAADINQDGLVNDADVTGIADIIMGTRPPQQVPPPAILSTSPGFGEGNVSLNRQTIFRFTQPLAATNVIGTSTLYAQFGGRRILSRFELASDLRTLTLFYLEPLPASARIRVTIDGGSLAGSFGLALDADGDGAPGGVGYIEFDTASISPVPGTAVIGTVYASQLAASTNSLTNTVNVPIAGVTITVDGAEQTLRTVTDTNGFFRLMPCPAGRFFVHVDGRTVTNVAAGIRYPDLAYYPFVGKAWEAVAGYTNNLAGGSGLIYLPLIAQGTLQTVSMISNTVVTFPPSVIASNPALAGVSMTVPANALYNDNGQRGGKVGIAPVSPDRLPEPLPPGLNFPLVITVQTDGAQNFGQPAPICFPNLPDPTTGVKLAPGAKTALWSFNHETGRWEIQGPMTVTLDGQMACTDPGVGIRQPGWHGTFPGVGTDGGPQMPDWNLDPNPQNDGQHPPADPAGDSCPGSPGGGPSEAGEPVNLFSGEYNHSEEDMRIKGVGLDFVWVRKFQSLRVDLAAPSLPFGPRWTHSYAIRLQFNYDYAWNCKPICGGLTCLYGVGGSDGGSGVIICPCVPPPPRIRSVSVVDGNGRRDEFFDVGTNTFRANGLFRDLVRNDDDTWTLTFEDKGKWVFSRLVDYQIVRSSDRHGNHLDFTYESVSGAAHRLRTITDTLQRPINISYNSANQIVALTDFTGRSVRYDYFAGGDPSGFGGFLEGVSSPSVQGTVTGNDFPSGKQRTYTYFLGPDYITGYSVTPNSVFGYGFVGCDYSPIYSSFIGLQTITDGRNNDPRDSRHGMGAYVTNYYSVSGSQAGNSYVYTSGSEVNQAGGSQWVQVPYLRLVRQTWGGQDLLFDYEQAGIPGTYNGKPALFSDQMLVTVRDRNGNVKDYLYDTLNECLRFREYSGRSAPGASVTVTSNRPAGLFRTSDPPVFETDYQYNGQFQPVLVTHPNGNQTAYQYRGGGGRASGNLIAQTNLPAAHIPAGDQASLTRQYQYDTDFNPCCGFNFATQITDPRGYNVSNQYSTNGDLTHRTFQITNVVEDFSYNSRGQLIQRILPDNGTGHRRVDKFDYYPSGPQNGYLYHAVIDATTFALTNTFQYDARGNVTRWIDPNGKDTQYIVNELDQVVRQISREVNDGTGIRYQKDYYYDANNNVTRIDVQNLDENGVPQPHARFTTAYEYDLLNTMTRKTEDAGDGHSVVTEYAYDGNRNLIQIRKGEATAGRQPANVVQFQYDERDLLFREIRAPGTADQSTTQYDYDGNKNLVRITQGLESDPRVTTLTYDGYDRLVSLLDPMGNETDFNHDANGNLVHRLVNGELTDVPGNTSNVRLSEARYQYDPMNRLTRQDKAFFETATQSPIAGGTASTRIEYSGTSQIIRLINANGHTNSIAYDTANRRRTLTDAAGNTITLDYDKNSNLSTITEVDKSDLGAPDESFTTRFQYDNLNRLTATIDNVNTTNTFGYDSRNNRTVHVNGRGNVVRYTFDGLNRALATIRSMTDSGDGSGAVIGTITTRQAWDDSSRLISQTDDNTNSTLYTYDALDRRVATTYADGTVHQTTYDIHNNAVLTLDANGTFVTNRFDVLDRLMRRDVSVGPGVANDTTLENYIYDGLSRLTLAQNDGSTVQLEYDSLSHVLKDIQSGTVVASTYDAMGNQQVLFYPSGRVVTNTYDVLERLKTLTDTNGPIARYDYVGPWRVKQRDYGNGTRMTYQYDGITGVANPPADFGVKQVIRTTHSTISNGVAFDDRVYRWDRAGNKTAHNELHAGGSSRAYSYDSIDRLVHSTKTPSSGPVEDIQYILDGVGNRLQVIGGADAGNYTMSAIAPEPADRQMNQYTTTPFGTESHDPNGNLIAMNAGQANQRLFAYDYRNRTVGATVRDSGVNARYDYDALGRRIGKFATGGSNEDLRFLQSGWRVVEELTATNTVAASYVHGRYTDELLEMRSSADESYYQSDDLFSVVSLTGPAGSLVERFVYSDYGLPTRPNGQSPGTTSRYFYTGRRFDDETGLYDYRTRPFGPDVGRFLSRDRIGMWTDALNVGNSYSYAGANPASRIDPFGLQPYSCEYEAPPNEEFPGYEPAPYEEAGALEAMEQEGPKAKIEAEKGLVDAFKDFLDALEDLLLGRGAQWRAAQEAESMALRHYYETGQGTVTVYYDANGKVLSIGDLDKPAIFSASAQHFNYTVGPTIPPGFRVQEEWPGVFLAVPQPGASLQIQK